MFSTFKKMQTLNHKTTILLASSEYEHLKRKAVEAKSTMGELIRLAIRQVYLVKPKKKKSSWNQISKLNAPVSDWETMEKEILKGRFKD